MRLLNLAAYSNSDYSILKSLTAHEPSEQGGLVFDSKFECGNLACAFQSVANSCHYDLFMQNDTNTRGYNQWFYFSIRGMQKGVTYRLNIVNFVPKTLT